MRSLRLMFLLSLFAVLGWSDDSNPAKHSEHMGVMHLVLDESMTGYASGPTSKLRVAPRSRLIVPAGATLTVDSDTTSLDIDALRFDNGSRLVMSNGRNVKLRASTIVGDSQAIGIVESSKHPQIFSFSPRGQMSAKCPKSGKPICNCGARDREHDPADLSGGMIWLGPFTVEGEPKTAIAEPTSLAKGTTLLKFRGTILNWKVGDRLMVPRVRIGDRDEIVTIKAIKSGGYQVDRAIAGDHKLPDGTWPTVGNLTRNVVFRSESTNLKQKAHLMFMHQATGVTLRYGACQNMGRTSVETPHTRIVRNPDGSFKSGDENTVGRYPLHFHMLADADRNIAPNRVVGWVVEGSPKHGFVNHGAHVDFTDCIAVNCPGSGFFGENGTEIGSFVNWLSVNCSGPSYAVQGAERIKRSNPPNRDFGFEGHGVWLQSGGIEVRAGNGYGCKRSIIEVWGEQIIEGGSKGFPVANLRPGATKNAYAKLKRSHITADKVPVLIHGNQGAGAKFGFFAQMCLNDPSPEMSLFSANKMFNVESGVSGHYAGHMEIDGCDLRGTGAISSRRVGGVADSINFRSLTIRNSHIEGFTYGVCDPGIGPLTVENVTFKENVTDLFIIQPNLRAEAHPITISDCRHLGRTKMAATWKATKPALRIGAPRNYEFQAIRQSSSFNANTFVESRHTIDGRPLYYEANKSDFVPFASAVPGVGGKTNRQLWEQAGMAVLGRQADVRSFELLKDTNLNVWLGP